MKLKLAVAAFVAFLLVIFTAQNYQVVELRFLFWKLEMSRAVMITALFFGGFSVGLLVSNVRRITRA